MSETKIKELEDEIHKLAEENNRMKAQLLHCELEEENITNQLFKRLDDAKQEKERLLIEVEQEEERLTNTLHRKLQELRQEKIDIENQLEQEEEFLTNKLQKELEILNSEIAELEQNLSRETEQKSTLHNQLSDHVFQLKKLEDERGKYVYRNNQINSQIQKHKTDNFVLQQKLKSIKDQILHVKQEKVQLESDAERELERQFFSQRKQNKRGRSVSYNPSKHIDEDSLDSDSEDLDHVPSISINDVRKASNPMLIASRRRQEDSDEEPSGNFAMFPASFSNAGSLKNLPLGTSLPSSMGKFNPLLSFKAQSLAQQNLVGSPGSYIGSYVGSSSYRSGFSEPKQSIIKSGILKKLRSDGSWGQYLLSVNDNGELVCSDASETSVSIHVHLDTVTAITDKSKQPLPGHPGAVCPNFSFEIKTKFCSYFINCENEAEHQQWMNLLRELAPLITIDN